MKIHQTPSDPLKTPNYMQRALELATLGRGQVSPNPMVGCVIVYQPATGPDRIIGEGWHQQYGGPHAEVSAMRSVQPEDEHLLTESTVYVTLEPCSHWGKTPPCADLLIAKRVNRVVCCNDDPNPLVSGQGFAKLRAAGIAVETGLLAEQGREVNKRFFLFFEKKRPYLLLKWAETADGFIAGAGGKPTQISGDRAHRLVHRWRSEEDAILVGTNTARLDNPQLNVRLWTGRNPTRIVVDKNLTLPTTLNLFDDTQPTVCYNFLKTETIGQTAYQQLQSDHPVLPQLLADLHRRQIQSVLVEGGTILLQSLLDAGLWDEIALFRSPVALSEGVKAPVLQNARQIGSEPIGADELRWFKPL